jgi:hypothetical protein
MAAVQTSYSDASAVGTPGMVANTELVNKISRVLEGADLAFGVPVIRGSADALCALASQETLEAAATAYAGNTGNGAMGAITVSAGAKVGTYKLTITEPASNVGNFIVEDPDGITIGQGDVAAAFSAGGLAFTLADGSTDFSAGDGFNIVVTPTSETAVGEFLGISVRDTTLGAEQDVYEEGDTVAVMTQGVIWVTAGASVTPADPVYWNPATSRYTKTTTHFPVPGAAFDTSGGNGDLVRLALR